MSSELTVYIVGDYKAGAADGLAEFSYQNVELLREEFEFQFIEFDDAKNNDYYNSEVRNGILVHRFGSKKKNILKLPVSFGLWVRNIQKNDIIFHLHHIYNIRNYLIAKILLSAGIPYLITPHDSYVYGDDYKKTKSLVKNLYRSVFVRVFDKFVLDHATVIHAITQQCVPSLQSITDTRIIVVENQVKDLNLSFDLSELKHQVCFIGRISILQKGVDLGLLAFKIFQHRYRFAGNVNFTLVGPANPEAELELENICRNLNFFPKNNVVFTGMLPENKRQQVLSASRVYMQLSRYEGFGLSVAQALSCFKPVILSKQIPIGDKVLKHNAGFIVKDAEEAATALEKIFSLSPDEYSEMALNARRCYEQEFHPAMIKPQLIKLYKIASRSTDLNLPYTIERAN